LEEVDKTLKAQKTKAKMHKWGCRKGKSLLSVKESAKVMKRIYS
jgi:hypothetical protein